MTEKYNLPLEQIIEGLLLAANKPLSVDQITAIFEEGDNEDKPKKSDITNALASLAEQTESRGVELIEVASGWRYQVRKEYSHWIGRLWEEKPQKYTRALLETLSLIVYRQPITRGEIEEIRGVAVSSNIIRTLQERDWVRIVGHREAPGRPAMYATTRQFMDYFNLKNLNDLPPLMAIRELDESGKMALTGELQVQINTDSTSDAHNSEQHKQLQQSVMPLDPEEVKAKQQAHSSSVQALFEELDEMEASIKTSYDDLSEEELKESETKETKTQTKKPQKSKTPASTEADKEAASTVATSKEEA